MSKQQRKGFDAHNLTTLEYFIQSKIKTQQAVKLFLVLFFSYKKKKENMENHDDFIFEIEEELPDHHFRTEIPNIIFDIGLKPLVLATYCYLKRIAGDRGASWKSNSKLAEHIGVCKKTLKEIIKFLESSDNNLKIPLIKVTERFKPDGSPDTNLITIINIWKINGKINRDNNLKRNENKTGGGGVSVTPGGVSVTPGGVSVTPGGVSVTPKEEPSQEEKKEERKKSSDLSFFSNLEKKEEIQDESNLAKLELLKPIGLEDSFVQVLIAYPLDQITNGLNAALQWRNKRASEGESLGCLGSAIVRATIAKWKPSKSDEDIEKERNIEENRRKDEKLLRYQQAIELLTAEENHIPYEYSFKVSTESITLRLNNRYCPLDLNQEDCIEILKDHIQRYKK